MQLTGRDRQISEDSFQFDSISMCVKYVPSKTRPTLAKKTDLCSTQGEPMKSASRLFHIYKSMQPMRIKPNHENTSLSSFVLLMSCKFQWSGFCDNKHVAADSSILQTPSDQLERDCG